ncbi:MAG: poly-beta-1,6-N-acetyl-D-glucosamine N-deacetylase PgaB [Terracidiphilus sp.]|jgi:biofilm PGA synthesis lipoprotein PgaB
MRRLLIFLSLLQISVAASSQSGPENAIVLCYHDVRDEVGGSFVWNTSQTGASGLVSAGERESLDAEQYTTSTRNLASHFDWLRAHGYHIISLQQLVDARTGHGALPDKAVLLTFDDGLRSVYTKVFPLLKAFKYPAVVAVVGAWADLSPGGKVENGAHPFYREDFATWNQLREMQDSGLVEIASHTFDQHHGIPANPQGNLIPAVATHAYDPTLRTYETDDEYAERLRTDLAHSSDEIRSRLGRAPRALMWPYGAYTQLSDSIAMSLGMQVTFTLGENSTINAAGLQAIPRIVMLSNPSVGDLAWELQHREGGAVVRAVQVDLDYVYDPDPAQQERNLGVLLDRIKALQPTQVWLQAFSDPGGDDSASAVYFPNHWLPMRADLFSRVAWQLSTRCGVQVYAWMPVLGWRLPDAEQQARLQIHPRPGVKSEKPVRLNPFLPETRTLVGGLYEDMARSAPLSGILFHDDAVLRDTDDLGPQVPLPGADRTKALIEFTNELKARVSRWSPEVKTARNLFAEPVLNPSSEQWYAQSLPAFLLAYDEVAVMAMPRMEKSANPNKWLLKLTENIAKLGGLDHTVFELQTVDWGAGDKPISSEDIAGQLRLLQVAGARNLAYYPDDFLKNHPALKVLRPQFSASDYFPLWDEGAR